jgi:hypothetical protein
LLKYTAAIFVSMLASAAAAQVSSMQPASTQEIATAVSACMAAVRPNSVDDAALIAAGWSRGVLKDAKGKTIPAPVNIYGRKGASLMLLTTQGKGACTTIARIERPELGRAVADAISAQVKSQPKRDKNKDLFWFAGKNAIQLAATGDVSKPAVRIVVLQIAEKK